MLETIETVIVGGGQAGLSLSHELKQAGHEHVVLEKAARVGESWRNQRWDSFTLVTPNWSFRLPGAEFHRQDPQGFKARDDIVRCFEAYAENMRLPVRYNTRADAIEREDEKYRVETNTTTTWQARNVVIATGLYQRAKVPPFASRVLASVKQIHCSEYRNPNALPPGAVLVVGSGQSGSQIAEELRQSGRQVYLSTGFAPHAPRRYRGRDIYEWADLTGFLSRTPEMLPSPAARFGSPPILTGKDGGRSLSLHYLHRAGITLLGHLRGYESGRFIFADDLKENLAKNDKAQADLITQVDGFIAKQGIDAPQEELEPAQDAYQLPDILALDPVEVGIGVLVWANGFRFDYSLVRLPVTDEFGFPVTQRGKTHFPGLYFLGMPWLNAQKTGFLLGIAEAAAHTAEQITASASN